MIKPGTLLFTLGVSAALIGSCTPASDDESSDIPGFGTSCGTQSECSTHRLICDGTVCVQCIEEADCRATEDCKGGRCVGSISCSTVDDCPRPLVCHPEQTACVECVDNRDCTGEASCLATRCVLNDDAIGNAGNGGSSAGGSNSSGGGTTGEGGMDQGGAGGVPQGGQGSGGEGSGGVAAGGSANGGAGGASGGSGGSGGDGGSGGADPGPQYCDDKAKEAIPYNVQDDFIPYLLFGDIADISIDDQTVCDGESAPDATIFGCSVWEYSAATGDHGGVAWSYPLDDFAVALPGLCVADAATVVEFYVRGEDGGEEILFGAGGGPRVVLTLTAGWTKHTVSLLSPPNTNTPGGVKEAFAWSATAADNPAGVRFYVGNITLK
ncbi:MAG TPA: hypothetical protein VHO25_22370 [Polyangiaceae bacterium]|nr:hypothetical protein [Polyangiaceae bacterium]